MFLARQTLIRRAFSMVLLSRQSNQSTLMLLKVSQIIYRLITKIYKINRFFNKTHPTQKTKLKNSLTEFTVNVICSQFTTRPLKQNLRIIKFNKLTNVHKSRKI